MRGQLSTLCPTPNFVRSDFCPVHQSKIPTFCEGVFSSFTSVIIITVAVLTLVVSVVNTTRVLLFCFNRNYGKRRKECSGYDVFLSFRGPDLRKTFVDHLIYALELAGFSPFRDNDPRLRGENIDSMLKEGIENSGILIPIFSTDYAESTACLDEALLMVRRHEEKMVNKESTTIAVAPLFFVVTPDDVGRPDEFGPYARAFEKHESSGRYSTEEIKERKDALIKLSKISGWVFPQDTNGYEGALVKVVVEYVANKLKERCEASSHPGSLRRNMTVAKAQQPVKVLPSKSVKMDTSSSEDDSSESDEEPKQKMVAKAKQSVKAVPAKSVKIDASSSEEETSDSDEEPKPKLATKVQQSVKVVPAKSVKMDTSSSEEESSESDEEPKSKMATKVQQTVKTVLVKSDKMVTSSSEEETSESDEEPKPKMATKVQQPVKAVPAKSVKMDTSSSEEESSESDEEPKQKMATKVQPPAKAVPAKSVKMDTSSSEEETSESDEEPKPKMATNARQPVKSVLAKPVKKGTSSSEEETSESDEEMKPKMVTKTQQAAKIAKKESSSEDSSDESDDEPTTKPQSVKVTKSQQLAKIVKKESSEEDSSDESDDEPKAKKQSVKVVKTPQPAKVVKEESSSDEDESSDESSDESDAKPKVKQQIVKIDKGQESAKVLKKESSSEEESSEESDDEPKNRHQEAKISKREKDSDEGMEDMEGQTASVKKTLATPKYQKDQASTPKISRTPATPGTKTLFVGNLSYSVDKDSLYQFFEDAGEVVDVRLSVWEDGSSRGFAHVRFATEEAAGKAMDKNGQDLFGRSVKVDLAVERGTPAAKQDWSNNSSQQGQKSVCTAFVRGFDKYQEENDIRNSLGEHFADCGKIENIRIPKDYESGAFKGFAYIEFKDNAALSKALELSSDELSVAEAMPSKSGGRDGSGRSGGRDGSGRRGGRGFGDGGGRGFGDGGGRFSGGRGRGTPRGRGRGTPKIDITSSATGKKTTFGDD